MIRPIRPLLTVCLAAAAMVTAGVDRAQGPPAKPAPEIGLPDPGPPPAREKLPPVPAGGLLDEGNVFKGEDGELMSADIEDFGHRVGMPVFVVTADYIFGDTVEQYGERLVTEWLQGKPGVVLVYERGSGQVNYSATRSTAAGSSAELRTLFGIGSRAAALMPDESTAAQRIRSAVQAMTVAGEEWKKSGKLADGPPAAQGPAPTPTPETKDPHLAAPVDFVLDTGDVFDIAEEASLKSELVKFHIRHDMDVYVVTNTWLTNTTAAALSQDLAQSWLADRYGAVIVLNRGTGAGEQALAIAGAALNNKIIAPAVESAAITRALGRAAEIQNTPGGSLPEALRAASAVVVETLVSRGAPSRLENDRTTSSGQWRVLTGIAGALVVGTLLLYLFHRVQERLESRSNQQFLFPDVTVDRRLGSPQGGGQVAGIAFARKGPDT